MKNDRHCVDLTPAELSLIEAALHTQEKILSVQSRAGHDVAAERRLGDLQSVIRNLRRQTPEGSGGYQSWTQMARGLFG